MELNPQFVKNSIQYLESMRRIYTVLMIIVQPDE